jgi:crossover junction endodeoxyribonuclease RuvC
MRFVGIDPASHTGFVALDENGEILRVKELTGSGDSDASKMRTLHDEVYRHLKPDDMVAIEDFALDAYDTNRVASGYNHASRMATDRVVGSFMKVGTGQLKKFVNVSEFEGDKGSKTRLKGEAVKRLVIAAVEQHWDFETANNNIADAYVLARIMEAVHVVRNGKSILSYPAYQRDVINYLLDPAAAKAAKKTKSKKSRSNASAAGKRGPKTEQTLLF